MKPKMRMPWRGELRWLIADTLIGWAFKLMRPEMTLENAKAMLEWMKACEPDPRAQTVEVRRFPTDLQPFI